MKKFFSFCLMGVMALMMASCGDGNAPQEYTIKPAIDGCLPGLFAVSATEKVRFAKGNLQFYYDSHARSHLTFAEKQYDVVSKSDNEQMAGTTSVIAEVHMDLFGWGTGKNPKRTSTDLSQYTEYNELGANAINDGGNTENQWRTLSKKEWEYLLNTRPNAEKLFGYGMIGDVKGLILLPDGEWPLSFTSGLNLKNGALDYSVNSYTEDTWKNAIEPLGAVFLPVQGWRHGTDVVAQPTHGYYWTCSPSGDTKAYYLEFGYNTNNGIRIEATDRSWGYSVRLVH